MDEMEPVRVPVDGILDLHTFSPRDLPDLLSDYLSLCRAKGILSVRIIHGKGSGVLKTRVRSLLAGNPVVRTVQDAPPESGGWGSTIVELTP